jgi:aspartyl-tRNA(Asn)/glutamyl-tRNA(Gln) amidotransferase subunit C
MQLTKKEIEKIATLARLRLTEEEKEKFAQEISAILGYIEILRKVDTSGVDLNLAEGENTNQTRADVSVRSENQEKILANAPMREDNFIKVKSVL